MTGFVAVFYKFSIGGALDQPETHKIHIYILIIKKSEILVKLKTLISFQMLV